MVRKLGGPDDTYDMLGINERFRRANKAFHSFTTYRTGQYKLHYFETPTNLKFVMLTDIQTLSMRSVLHQVYVNLYVEFGKLLDVISKPVF